jgi:ectoine hydroxylase-related dioxygenase (phytanoyl-CoA dioxygenase family)
MYLSESQINDYERNGAIVIKGVFKDWIDCLRTGFDKVLAEPSEHGRENVAKGDAGRFFEDYCNWQRIEEFKRWIVDSPAAEIAAEATRSKRIQVFHEHILIKEPGTAKATPWHQDMPYYCVSGEQTASYWVPLDPVTKTNTLQVVLGSHLWPKLVRPTRWSTNEPWYNSDVDYMDMPVIDARQNIMVPELELGDCVLFNFKTVHGAPGNSLTSRRRAFSTRFMGDDVRYINRGGPTSPPFVGLVQSDGDKMPLNWFPEVYNNDK